MTTETKHYLYSLIRTGTTTLAELTKNERRKLISTFICELKDNFIWEDQFPSRFMMSSFLENPSSTEAAHRIADELTDCIFFANEHRLEEMFDEMMAHYERERGMICEFDEHRAVDNHERYLDFKAAGF